MSWHVGQQGILVLHYSPMCLKVTCCSSDGHSNSLNFIANHTVIVIHGCSTSQVVLHPQVIVVKLHIKCSFPLRPFSKRRLTIFSHITLITKFTTTMHLINVEHVFHSLSKWTYSDSHLRQLTSQSWLYNLFHNHRCYSMLFRVIQYVIQYYPILFIITVDIMLINLIMTCHIQPND